ncbi:MAG: hypothetical protein ACRDPT_09635 [Streptomycetales bacterium]
MAAEFALTGVTRNYRRVLIIAPVLGGIGLVVSAVLGHVDVGILLCVGLALGFLNTRMVLSAAAKFSSDGDHAKRPLVLSALRRLAVITAVALLVAVAFRPEGVAVLGGLALYQLLLLGNTSGALLREVRKA